MKKRLLSLVLVFSFILGTLPVNVLAGTIQTEKSQQKSKTIIRKGKANAKSLPGIIGPVELSYKFPEGYVAVKFFADDSGEERGEFDGKKKVLVYAVNPSNTKIDMDARELKGKKADGITDINEKFPTYSVRQTYKDIWEKNDEEPWKMEPANVIKADKKIDLAKLEKKELIFTAQYVNKKGKTIASILQDKLSPQDIKVWKDDPIDWEKGVKKEENGLTEVQERLIKDQFTDIKKGQKVEGKAKFEDVSTTARDSSKADEKPFVGKIKVTFSDKSELFFESQKLYVSDHLIGNDNKNAPDNAVLVKFKIGEGVKAGNTIGDATPKEYSSKYKVKPKTDLDQYKLKIYRSELTIFQNIKAEVTDNEKYSGVVWEGETAGNPKDHVVTDSNRVFTAKATKIFTVKHKFKGIDPDKQGTPEILANEFPDELKYGAKSLIPEDKKANEKDSYTPSNITTKVTQTIKDNQDEVTAVYEWTFKKWDPNKIENISEDKTVTGTWERRQATSAAPDVTTPKEGDKTIKGKGEPESEIKVKIPNPQHPNNLTEKKATVEHNGTWEVEVPEDKPLKKGDKITVEQTEKGKKPNTKDVTVEKDRPTPAPTPTPGKENDRVHGKDRFETAIEISKKYFGQADTVIVVDSKNFPDAMTASVLSKLLKAPILLTDTNKLDPRVKAEIERLGAKDVIIVGGNSAVSEEVENELAKLDKDGVERIHGKDRYETAAQVARRVVGITGKLGHAVVASGEVFADAQAVAPYASREGYPILLVEHDSLPPTVDKAIKDLSITKVTIAGGYSAVAKSLESPLPTVVERLEGETRYETAIDIATKKFNTNKIFLANGEQWMDALVIGPVGGILDMPVLLTPANSAQKSQKDYIAKERIQKITAVGGISRISDEVLNELSK